MQWRKAAGEWQQQLDQHQVEEAAGRGRRERRELAASRFRRATANISRELVLVFLGNFMQNGHFQGKTPPAARLLGKAALRSAPNRPPWPSLTCCRCVGRCRRPRLRLAVATPLSSCGCRKSDAHVRQNSFGYGPVSSTRYHYNVPSLALSLGLGTLLAFYAQANF